ncbi:MAG: tRNA (guanosine(46)-N7)-methyltransferase TrmB [Paludibacteraceae bacterium]|nr:tRNA (guanosine(46)-N7)-methyltransferase TrmB [Paludibacteraceae bacterium]
MGKNKLQKFAEMEEYDNVFQYPFARLQAEGGFPLKGRWSEVFGNDHPIVLELGCGRGEYTVGLARHFANRNFIGVDIKGARMWAGAKQSNLEGLKNAAFLRTDIELIDQFFAPGEVSELWITFPDPQMKKVRKRLTSTRFLELYRHILKDNGLIHLKTDSPFLYTYTDALVQCNKLKVNDNTPDLYGDGRNDEILSIRTYYEQQWLDRGLTIKYLQFELPWQGALVETDIEIEPDSYRSFNRSRRSQQNQ